MLQNVAMGSPPSIGLALPKMIFCHIMQCYANKKLPKKQEIKTNYEKQKS